MQNEELWQKLTRVDAKIDLYARETYFREGLFDAMDVLEDRFGSVMRRAAILMIKPDGLAAGKAREIVKFLADHGFAITAVETPELGRFHWRELWRFQLTSATLDRLSVNALVLQRPAALLMLRDESGSDLPATVRLSVLKGPSDVASQPSGCLRRLICQPNRVFSFFHVADEPADFLRELAILLEPERRRRLLASLETPQMDPEDRSRLARVLEADARCDVDAGAAVGRALRAVEKAGERSRALESVEAQLLRMRDGHRIAWRPFMLALRDSGLELDEWDVATLGASYIVYDEPGHAKQIGAVDPSHWRPELPDKSIASRE